MASNAGAGTPPKPQLRVPPKPPLSSVKPKPAPQPAAQPASAPKPAQPTPGAPAQPGMPSLQQLKQQVQQTASAVQKNAERLAKGNALAKPRGKKSLKDLRKVGLERPKAFKKPAQRRSTQKSPSKRPVSPKLLIGEMQAMQARIKDYAEREAKASGALKGKLSSIRAKLAPKKPSFQVGATSVAERPLAEITGLQVTLDPKVAKAQKAKSATRKGKPNLVRATMRERATPPPSAPKKEVAHADADDHSPMADSKLIVTPDDTKGSKGAWFPSSAMPSPTNPQFSWRDKLAPVRNQQYCGSCWAFAVIGAYEGSQSLQNAQELDLSEQQLVNCVPPHPATSGNNCQGNMPATALEWMMTNGSPFEQALPYKSTMASCNSSIDRTDTRAAGWGFVNEDDPQSIPSDELMKQAIATHGPIAVTVFVTEAFQTYTGGIFDENAYGRPNHALDIVGWDDGRRAWHVRNSWGTGWGEDGYIWVKYGANSIGYLASWVDAEKLKKPEPEERKFKDRYVSVRNDSGEDLDVSVQALVPSGSSFAWAPADPGGAQAWKVRVPAGSVVDVKRPDTNKFLRAKKVRVWASSTDGKRSWSDFKAKDLNVANKAYKAAKRDHFTHDFTKGGAAPDADDVLTTAHELKDDGKLSDAHEQYGLFVELFPEDDRVPEARFFGGWTENQLGEHWDAVQELYEMVTSAPEDDSNLPYAFYYLGDSYSNLGFCGYAVRSLEVVAFGELDAPKEWVTAAKNMIKFLNEDDGSVCANWD